MCPLGAARHDLGRYQRLNLTRQKPQGEIGQGTERLYAGCFPVTYCCAASTPKLSTSQFGVFHGSVGQQGCHTAAVRRPGWADVVPDVGLLTPSPSPPSSSARFLFPAPEPALLLCSWRSETQRGEAVAQNLACVASAGTTWSSQAEAGGDTGSENGWRVAQLWHESR